MALPKLIHPTKKIKIESLGVEAEFEPFTTQDEKAIILLDKNASLYEKSRIQKDILEKCCKTAGIDFGALSSIETTYLFLQLRRISVGGDLELVTTCPECKVEIPIAVPIENVKFDASKLKPLEFTVATSEGPYIITCTQISVEDLQYINKDQVQFDDMAVVLRTMMRPDGNDIIELTQEEKRELFNQLDATTAAKIVEYVNNAPMLEHHLDIECPECHHKFGGELKDFFI